ncbi:kxDL motif-containing protein 1 isoform X3 [Pangasianodon hypophthalmus]|uniref:kxDL motif-containing protein 1 isoform X3 n=1 Tax=Pangasianodon hypophthalmus TaxID=310915 RepID=UPI0023080245|nr:kxDL motif-containing protein 1 isoform X3 [Pangasianodon hypophthalmus]
MQNGSDCFWNLLQQDAEHGQLRGRKRNHPGPETHQMNDRFLLHTRTLIEMKKDLDSVFRRIRTLKGKIAKQYPEAFSNIREASSLEDDDDDFDPVPPSVATTTAMSEQSTESCDTSPDVISPTISRCSELSQENPDTPTSNSPERVVLLDEGPDSINI